MNAPSALPLLKYTSRHQLPAELCAGESFGDWIKKRTP